MSVIMVALNIAKNGGWIARKVIPADARAEYKRLYGVGREAILKVSPGTSKPQAKALHGQWLAEVETRVERIRAAAKGEGQPLTRVDALALAGLWHLWFVARHEAEPGEPNYWDQMNDEFVHSTLRPHTPAHLQPSNDEEWAWSRAPEVRAAVRPYVAEKALVASFLAAGGHALTPEAYALFVDAVADNLLGAYAVLELRARGDYSEDAIPTSFPPYRPSTMSAPNGLGCWGLFAAYVDAVRPAAGTVNRWRAVFMDLEAAFPKRGVASLTNEDAERWKSTLVTPKRSAVTVDAVWLSSANIVFGWAVKQKHIKANPFMNVKIDVPRRPILRETQAFTAEEAQVILRASLAITNNHDAFPRAKRWAMWLCAYSGARSGEVTQLRGQDITRRGDFYIMLLTPEAGTMKTSQARTVPIHEHLIEQGFIDFVTAQGNGPLFYNARSPEMAEDRLNPRQRPAAKARSRLGVWVRSLGIDDPEVGPTHGWRHTFKQIADRVQISEKISDAITGHAPATIGRAYGRATVEDMAAALKKFPRYDV